MPPLGFGPVAVADRRIRFHGCDTLRHWVTHGWRRVAHSDQQPGGHSEATNFHPKKPRIWSLDGADSGQHYSVLSCPVRASRSAPSKGDCGQKRTLSAFVRCPRCSAPRVPFGHALLKSNTSHTQPSKQPMRWMVCKSSFARRKTRSRSCLFSADDSPPRSHIVCHSSSFTTRIFFG